MNALFYLENFVLSEGGVPFSEVLGVPQLVHQLLGVHVDHGLDAVNLLPLKIEKRKNVSFKSLNKKPVRPFSARQSSRSKRKGEEEPGYIVGYIVG